MAKGAAINHLVAVLFCAPWVFHCIAEVGACFTVKGETECADASLVSHALFFPSPLQSVNLSILFLEWVKWRMAPAGEPNKSFALSAALNHSWQYCFSGWRTQLDPDRLDITPPPDSAETHPS